MIKVKRVYEPFAPGDGARFLVDRLWPRGVKRAELHLEAWLKDAAPSTALRQWFGHDPKKWSDFRKRYVRELQTNPDAVAPILAAARRGTVTLLYGTRDSEHNNAVALKDYIEDRLKKVRTPKKARTSSRKAA
jgi:uncharacterized protein YeaO (DUF488 family)